MVMPRRHFDRPCNQCGRLYWPSNSLQRFCSRPCSDKAATKERPTCHVCGVKVGMAAIACKRHLHAANRAKRASECPSCKQTFVPYRGANGRADKYCSMACYRSVVGQRLAMVALACPQCGAAFSRTRGAVKRVTRSFCSLACATTFNSGENNTNWRGGHDPNRGPGWLRIAAEVRERDGYRCRRCGKTEAENGQRLSVDHVIPWRTFATAEEANVRSNLVALCRPCHAKKARAERLWLKGDVLDMWQYQIAVAEPWKASA